MSKLPGRPKGARGEARERNRLLLEQGEDPAFLDKTYENPTPCKKCGTHIRYISSGGCVACNRTIDLRTDEEIALTGHLTPRQFAANERKRAINSGQPRYIGLPCKVCGGATRYTTNGGCVTCVNNKSVASRNAKFAVFHHETSLIMFMERPRQVTAAYDLCPAMAAYPGYAMVFTDKMPRRFIGQDVMLFPNEISKIAFQAITLHKQGQPLAEHHIIVQQYLNNAAVNEAWRAFHRRNIK